MTESYFSRLSGGNRSKGTSPSVFTSVGCAAAAIQAGYVKTLGSLTQRLIALRRTIIKPLAPMG